MRQFYSPPYLGETDKIGDLRSTIYWNPMVKTDANDAGKIDFFNAGSPGTNKVSSKVLMPPENWGESFTGIQFNDLQHEKT